MAHLNHCFIAALLKIINHYPPYWVLGTTAQGLSFREGACAQLDVGSDDDDNDSTLFLADGCIALM